MNSRSETLRSHQSKAVVLNANGDEGNRHLISEVLRRSGFTVEETSDGATAVRRVSSRTDVVVLDAALPDLDGFEVCRRIKAAPETASVPVLLLTAQTAKGFGRADGLESGADGYLTQPIEPRELLAVVGSLLRLRQAEQAHAREARRAMLAADLVLALNDSQPLSDDLKRCAAAFVDRLDVDAAGIWLATSSERRFRLAAVAGANRVSLDGIREYVSFEADDDQRPRSFGVGEDSWEGRSTSSRGSDPKWLIQESMRSGVSYPLVEGRTVGLLELYSKNLGEAELLGAVAGPAETLALGIERKQIASALRASEEVSQRRQDRVRQLEEELAALDRLANASSTTVTAQAYGSMPLRESNAEVFEELARQFESYMELALEERSRRVDHRLSDRLRELGDRLGFLRAGPRDVIDVYSTALKRVTANVTEQKDRAYVAEGRLLVLELMGNVLSYYRAASLGAIRRVSRERSREGSPKGAKDA